jgi:hypothetical protein
MPQITKTISTFYKKIFLDINGRFVVSQWPNWPLLVWIACVLLTKVIKSGFDYTIISWAGTLALVYWAYLELFYGVNYFRRSLGLVVLVYIITKTFF